MVDQRYIHSEVNVERNIAHLSEECAELIVKLGTVVQACGKTLRHGLDSTDPTIPMERRISNALWIRVAIEDVGAEARDVKFMMERVTRILLRREEKAGS